MKPFHYIAIGAGAAVALYVLYRFLNSDVTAAPLTVAPASASSSGSSSGHAGARKARKSAIKELDSVIEGSDDEDGEEDED